MSGGGRILGLRLGGGILAVLLGRDASSISRAGACAHPTQDTTAVCAMPAAAGAEEVEVEVGGVGGWKEGSWPRGSVPEGSSLHAHT